MMFFYKMMIFALLANLLALIYAIYEANFAAMLAIIALIILLLLARKQEMVIDEIANSEKQWRDNYHILRAELLDGLPPYLSKMVIDRADKKGE